LFNWKVWILRLRYCCHEHIKATGIDTLPPQTAELFIHPLRIPAPELTNAAYSE
jgi:hypothetical protein